MALVLDGSAGISGVDGTASNPAIEGTDSNTGIFYPAADTVAIGTGGTEALRVNSSQNVGVGTQSPAVKLDVAGNATIQNGVLTVGKDTLYDAFINTPESMYFNVDSDGNSTNNKFVWGTDRASNTGGTTWMTLDASGNLQLAGGSTNTTFTSGGQFAIKRSTNAPYMSWHADDGTRLGFIQMQSSGPAYLSVDANQPLAFQTNATERARFTSDGYFKATQSSYLGTAGAYHEFSWNTANSMFFYHTSTTAANAYGLEVRYKSTPNGTGNAFLGCYDTDGTTQRFTARANGGLANYSANNVNLSDRREKTNFAPAKNYLDVICAIPVQTFNYIDQNMEEDPGETLGVVAQDVQAVAPEMVMESNWGTEEEPKMRLSIYQTDLQYALMKSIQELKAIVDAQAAEIAALKGNA